MFNVLHKESRNGKSVFNSSYIDVNHMFNTQKNKKERKNHRGKEFHFDFGIKNMYQNPIFIY